jgi:MFS family permease
LLAASFVSSIGSGLTIPFLIIYLHQVRHFPLGISGLLIGGVAVVALPVGPSAGALADRLGARTVLLVALSLEGLGIASLATVHNYPTAVGAMFLYGLGQAACWPTWNALLGTMLGNDKISALAFARNFQLLNLGLGLGAIIGGMVVHVHDPGSFVAVYLIDGSSNLIVVAALALLPERAFHASHEDDTLATAPTPLDDPGVRSETSRNGYRAVLADGVFRRYALATTILMIGGYAAIDTGFVGFATSVAKAGTGTIAIAFAANTSLIVLAQPLGLRLAGRMKRTNALKVVAGAFAASWVVLAAASLAPGTQVARVLVIATPAVFALGEVLLSPVGSPLVNDLAPAGLRGRYFATSSLCFTVANIVSPAIAGVMIGADLGRIMLVFFIICCATAAAGAHWLGLALSPAQNNAREARS